MVTTNEPNAPARRRPDLSTRQMRHLILVAVAFSLALFSFSFSLAAQEPAASLLSIHVTDPTGSPVAHASIRLFPVPDPAPAKMETDNKGELAIYLKPGGYALFVSCAGFKSVSAHIDVAAAKEIQIVPIRLELAPTGSPVVFPTSMKNDLHVSTYPYHADVFLKPADLRTMPRTTVTVHNEHANAQETYTGVRVSDLLLKMGAPLGKDLRGAALSTYLLASGSDGYEVVLAIAEVDPTFHSGEVIVADTMNDAPLDPKSGPFKLVVTEDKRPARWVRNLVSIDLKSAK